jgi:hypothetical protein
MNKMDLGQPDYIGLAPEFNRAGEELGYPTTDLNVPFTEGMSLPKWGQ